MSECIIIAVDNSEYALNEDYLPSRWQAQHDVVTVLASAKTDGNPETTVGILSLAGKAPTIVVTPTQNQGKILNCMHDMKIGGRINLATGIQIAQLALKHRENKNQRQRIVLFVGSPIAESRDALVKIAKKLKKNNISLDLVLFGSESESHEDLRAFFQAAENGNATLVEVHPGQHLDDCLISSRIIQENGGGSLNEFGVDPNLDPEMAMALQMSAQEAQAAATAAAASGEAAPGAPDAMDLDEDALLQRAIELSRGDQAQGGAQGGTGSAPAAQQGSAAEARGGAAGGSADAGMFDADPELQMAMQMSMMDAAEEAKKKDGEDKDGGKDPKP